MQAAPLPAHFAGMPLSRLCRQFRRLSAGEIIAVGLVFVTGLDAIIELVRWLGTAP